MTPRGPVLPSWLITVSKLCHQRSSWAHIVVFLKKLSRNSMQAQGVPEKHSDKLSCVALGWEPISHISDRWHLSCVKPSLHKILKRHFSSKVYSLHVGGDWFWCTLRLLLSGLRPSTGARFESVLTWWTPLVLTWCLTDNLPHTTCLPLGAVSVSEPNRQP